MQDILSSYGSIHYGHSSFKLKPKFKSPQTYSQKEGEEMIAATKYKEYHIEEHWIKGTRELKINPNNAVQRGKPALN